MGLTAATGGFVVLFLSVSAAESLPYISAQICAVRGSTVDMRCIYRRLPPSAANRRPIAVEKTLWFTEMQDGGPVDLRADSEYAGRVKYYCDKDTCTLRIARLRESDSAEYKFTFKNKRHRRLAGVTLFVTDPDLQVQVRRSYSTWAELFCHSVCHLPERPSYIWYRNGQRTEEETSSYSDYFDPADSYSCAVKAHEGFPAPPVCVDGQSCNRVTYADRSIFAFKGSSVDISCTYSSYEDRAESKFWFSPERSRRGQKASRPEDLSEDSRYAGRVRVLETEGGRSTLRIADLRESDSAEYCFKFRTRSFEWRSSLPGTTLTVTALRVQVTRIIAVHLSHTEAELDCHSSCRPAGHFSHVWFKNGQKTQEETSSYTDFFYPGDNISCAFKGHEDNRSPSLYAPQVPSVLASPSGEITEGSSVTLTCSSGANPAAKYTWYKGNVNLEPLVNEAQLVFSSIRPSDSGEYHCAAEMELGRKTSEHVSVNVKYAPKLPSASASPSGEIAEGSSVTLTCSSDANPAATYTWYKGNQTLLRGPEGSYRFTFVSSEDRGTYHCKSENQYGQINSTSLFINVQYAPKRPSVSASPSAEIVEGGSVNLTCSSDANPAANYTWYRENEDSPEASGQIFTITDFRPEHGGNYYCEAENRRGRHRSTSHLTVVAGASSRAHVGNICTFVLLVLLLLLLLWIRTYRFHNQWYELRQRVDSRVQTLLRLKRGRGRSVGQARMNEERERW